MTTYLAKKDERASFIIACRGHEKMGELLQYFVYEASRQAKNEGIDTNNVNSMMIQRFHKDILSRVAISENSLNTYIKQLTAWNFLKGDGYRHTYEVCFHHIAYVIAHPPEAIRRKPRGKYALHGTFIPSSTKLEMTNEDARLVQLHIRRAELLTELRQIEDELAQSTFIIYGCVDPQDMTVFYVGIALDGERRFKQHLSCNDENEAKNARIQEILDRGYTPIFPEFEVIQGKTHALAREQYWIDFFLKRGIHLVNAEGRQAS